MSETIISAIITGLITLCGVFIANGRVIAVLQEKLSQIEKKVDKHEEACNRVPVLEERIKVANKRIDDLERGV